MKKLSLITAIISPIIVTVIFCVTRILYYPITDDYIYNFISKGTYTGEPNAFLKNITYPFGWIAKELYHVTESVNWFGIIYLIIILFCVYMFFSIFKRYVNDFYAILLALLLNITLLVWIHFTVLTYFALAIAIIKGLDVITNPYKRRAWNIVSIVATVILFSLSYSLRYEAFFSGGFSLLVIALFIIINYRKSIKVSYLLIVGILSVSLVFSIFIADKNAYSSEQWKDYLTWQKQRVAVGDYPIADYDKNQSLYKKLSMSRNDYVGLLDFYEADKSFYSAQRMKSVAQGTPNNERYDLNIISILSQMLKVKELWGLIIICLFCVLFDNDKKRKITYILQGLLTTGVVAYTYIIQRPGERVYIPMYAIGIIAIAYLFFRENDIQIKKSLRIGTIICTTIMVAMTALYCKQALDIKKFKEERKETAQGLITYMRENPNKLFVFNNYHHLLFNEPVLEIKSSDTYKNAMELSNYELYNDTYYKMVNNFNLKYPDRLLIDLVENDNVYYVAHNRWKVDNVITYISEHTKKQVVAKLVKDFPKDSIKVYKINYKKVK